MNIQRKGRKYNPIRKLCSICNVNLCDLKGKSVDGLPLYKTKCAKCRNNYKKKNRLKRNRQRMLKKYI